MIPPRWFLPYDVMIQLITAFVALAVGLFAYRGFALIRDRTFKALSIAFVLLSMGFFIKGLALAMAWAYGVGYAEHGALVNVLNLGFWSYYILSIAAFGILVYIYSRKLGEQGTMLAAAAAPTLLLVSPTLELVIVVLLLIVLIAQLAHLSVRRTKNAEVVTFGFAVLLFGHVLFMFSDANEWTFVLGSVLQFVAFASLLMILYRLRGPE